MLVSESDVLSVIIAELVPDLTRLVAKLLQANVGYRFLFPNRFLESVYLDIYFG